MINADTRHRAQASIGNRILRMRDLRERLGLSASHLYALIAAGRFPKPFPIIPGGRATGWLESTIDAYLTDCAYNRSRVNHETPTRNADPVVVSKKCTISSPIVEPDFSPGSASQGGAL
jgi:prophage regulatory protein